MSGRRGPCNAAPQAGTVGVESVDLDLVGRPPAQVERAAVGSEADACPLSLGPAGPPPRPRPAAVDGEGQAQRRPRGHRAGGHWSVMPRALEKFEVMPGLTSRYQYCQYQVSPAMAATGPVARGMAVRSGEKLTAPDEPEWSTFEE